MATGDRSNHDRDGWTLPEPGKRILIRRRFQFIVGVAGFGVFFGGFFFGFLGFLFVGGWIGAAVLAVPTVLCGLIFWGVAHIGLWVDADGLTLRSTFVKTRIAWVDVDHISPATEDWQKYVGIVLRDGRRVRCAALGAALGEPSARLDPYVQQLETLLAQVEPTQPASRPSRCDRSGRGVGPRRPRTVNRSILSARSSKKPALS